MALNADKFNTWAPHFHVDVLQGTIPAAVLRERTLSLTLIDNAREYDTIEWTLLNNDGLLTRVENMALGLMIQVRIGYLDYTMNWRTFIISRMRGGVGVYGKKHPAVAEGDSSITLSGRNRNAPDLKGRRGKRGSKAGRMPKPGRSGRTYYRRSRGVSTASIVQLDSAKKDGLASPTELERTIRVTKLSDAIREIGRRMGYSDRRMFIADTEDFVAEVIIPQGVTYADFIHQQAKILGWDSKIGSALMFHPQRWRRDKQEPVLELTYGGPDILDLGIDADFRLPTPRSIKAKSYNPILREAPVAEVNNNNSAIMNKSAVILLIDSRGRRMPGAEVREVNLNRTEVFYTTGGMQNRAFNKAERAFINRHVRAMALDVTIVGNPHVEARNEVIIKGTGCQLVDGRWFIEQAQHIYNGETYTTKLDLRPPTKKKKRGGSRKLFEGAVKDKKGSAPTQKQGAILAVGTDVELGQVSGRR